MKWLLIALAVASTLVACDSDRPRTEGGGLPSSAYVIKKSIPLQDPVIPAGRKLAPPWVLKLANAYYQANLLSPGERFTPFDKCYRDDDGSAAKFVWEGMPSEPGFIKKSARYWVCAKDGEHMVVITDKGEVIITAS